MAWTPDDIPSQLGRVAVVTGANGGLGLETARELARKGARVVMAARDQDKAERARAALAGEIGGAVVEVRELDLASLASVRACADGIAADYEHLDVLVNNAGLMGIREQATAEGFEMQLGVNHLGHFVLTRRLLPALLAAPAGRVVTVTSFGRLLGRPVDPANPHLHGRYNPWRAYNLSKLANMQFALELDHRLRSADAPVRSVVAQPGLVHSDLQARSVRDTSGGVVQRTFHLLAHTVGRAPERGALPLLWAASDPDAPGGVIYGPRWGTNGPPVRRRPSRPPGRRAMQTLWEVSERETGETFDVAAIVRHAG